VVDETSDSTVRLHHNTWLMSPKGFQHPDGADFRLTADSPAIAKGIPVPPSMDDTGHPISIAFDFAGNPYGPIPCTGAYQAPSGN